MVGDLKAKSFDGDGSELSGITTDQLADVNSKDADKDQFLIYNGTNWVAEDFHIDTELTFEGGIDLTAPCAVPLVNGALYINNTDGVAHSSWTGIGGKTVRPGNAVGYGAVKASWFLLGDISSASVVDVEAGVGIDVDDSKPSEPVVSIDRAEVDTWYEPKFNKLSAFNKNFGTTAGTVSEGNHLHSQYLTGFTETDPTVPAHVKSISTADIAKWNTPAPAAPVSSVNGKTGAVVLAHGDVGAAPTSHTHSQYLTSFTESDPTVPAHVKSISTADIAKWNTPAAGGGAVDSVNGKTGVVVLSHTDVGAAAASHTHAYSPTNHTHTEYAAKSHTHTEYAAKSHTHSNYLTTVAAGNGTKLTGTNKIEMSGSYTGNFTASGAITGATLKNASNTAGDQFTVSANGHTVVKSVTSPSNLAGTHGCTNYVFNNGWGDTPGNVKATSTIATGKYHCDWTLAANFFAGQISIMATGAISDFYAYSVNTKSTGFFEGADLYTYENNVKGKQISFMMFAGIPSNSSVSPASINFDQQKYDQYMADMEAATKLEFCGGGHDDVFAVPNDSGCLTITTPYYSDYEFCIPNFKNMVKAKRSELPSILLHNGFRA
jgi:hypothetical protein